MLIFANEFARMIEHNIGTARVTGRKVQATIGLYGSNPLGYTRAAMAETVGCNSERRSQASKLCPSSD